jgi:hypothetical protein
MSNVDIIARFGNKDRNIKEGETLLGREELRITDKRCSKQQIQLTRNNNNLYIVRKGKNPSRILRGNEDIMLGQGERTKLIDGDVVEVVVTLYPLFISIKQTKPNTTDQKKFQNNHSINNDNSDTESLSLEGI